MFHSEANFFIIWLHGVICIYVKETAVQIQFNTIIKTVVMSASCLGGALLNNRRHKEPFPQNM